MDPLKAYLVKHFGLAADADEAAVRKMAEEKLTQSQMLDIIAPKASEPSALDKITGVIQGAIAKQLEALKIAPVAGSDGAATADAINGAAAAAIKAHGIGATLPDSQLQPSELLGGAAKAASAKPGQPRLKKATESYDHTYTTRCYPSGERESLHLGAKAGRPIILPDGRQSNEPSQAEKAQHGAYLKWQACKMSKMNPREHMTDHDWDLFSELVTDGKWVGGYQRSGQDIEISEPSALPDFMQKDYLEDTTSGGTYMIPYFFDEDYITYPLLYGELFPQVDLRELTTSNQVKTPTLGNMTISAGPSEDGVTNIALQSTAGLSTVLTSNVYNMTGAITIGRDMLQDSPIQLQAAFMDLFNKANLKFLDKTVAVGDGSTYPLGIVNTSGTATYSVKNGTAGPYTVADVQGIVKTLPKQYRGPKDKVVWVSSDSAYWRLRGISVSGTDQRLIYGYNAEQYMLMNRPFKVQNDIATSTLAYGRIDMYRMWRRKGLQMEATDDGKTLRLVNEMLVTVRSRWAGQVVNPNAWVLVTNGSVH